jgi:crossover junction endodeoxyribonuclease RuvC
MEWTVGQGGDMHETRILGIDPGLQITGYGLLTATGDRFQLQEAGVVRGPQRGDLGHRVQAIYVGVCEVLDGCRPRVLALEELYSHYQRPRTAILMGHARGVICLAAASRSIPVIGYSATQVKRILTGSGRAPKNQIQQAIQRELRLDCLPQPADVADALAIAICHFYLGHTRAQATQTDTRYASRRRGTVDLDCRQLGDGRP